MYVSIFKKNNYLKKTFVYKLLLFRKLQRLNEDLQEKLDTLQGELIHQNIR